MMEDLRYRGRRYELTPPAFFRTLDEEFRFDLDGACVEENKLCAEGSTQERPVSWASRRVFCNPPWHDIAPFLELAPAAEAAVLLVPSRTNARWWHRALELGAEVRYFRGRLRFVGATTSSPQDCCLLVFGRGQVGPKGH